MKTVTSLRRVPICLRMCGKRHAAVKIGAGGFRSGRFPPVRSRHTTTGHFIGFCYHRCPIWLLMAEGGNEPRDRRNVRRIRLLRSARTAICCGVAPAWTDTPRIRILVRQPVCTFLVLRRLRSPSTGRFGGTATAFTTGGLGANPRSDGIHGPVEGAHP